MSPIELNVDRIFLISVFDNPFTKDIARLSPTTEKSIATFWMPDSMW